VVAAHGDAVRCRSGGRKGGGGIWVRRSRIGNGTGGTERRG
jgi:hypothetical protein